MKGWPFFPLTPTRYGAEGVSLLYGRQEAVGWRFVINDRGSYALVGATYATKDELLADIPRYAHSWGLQ